MSLTLKECSRRMLPDADQTAEIAEQIMRKNAMMYGIAFEPIPWWKRGAVWIGNRLIATGRALGGNY